MRYHTRMTEIVIAVFHRSCSDAIFFFLEHLKKELQAVNSVASVVAIQIHIC